MRRFVCSPAWHTWHIGSVCGKTEDAKIACKTEAPALLHSSSTRSFLLSILGQHQMKSTFVNAKPHFCRLLGVVSVSGSLNATLCICGMQNLLQHIFRVQYFCKFPSSNNFARLQFRMTPKEAILEEKVKRLNAESGLWWFCE